MAFKDDLLANYLHERHFLQTVYMPAFTPKGRGFVYMKNHKAACTTIIATLMAHLQVETGDDRDISMENVHKPPVDLIHAGKRTVNLPRALDALNSKDVFRFTVVREPISRTVSAWADKVAADGAKKGKLLQVLGLAPDANLTLSEFLDAIAQEPEALNVDRHWRPQSKEISWGLIDYDMVGTVETIDAVLKKVVLTCFKSKKVLIQDTRKSLGHKTSSKDLIQGLSKADHKNIEKVFGEDLAMYETVKKQQA